MKRVCTLRHKDTHTYIHIPIYVHRKTRLRAKGGGAAEDEMDMKVSKHREAVEDREAWHVAVHGVAESDTT